MPELPEVEGFRRRLAPVITGRRVSDLTVFDTTRWMPEEGVTPDVVAGSTVIAVERFGKMLAITLSAEVVVVIHLKIAGQLVLEVPGQLRLVGGHPHPKPAAALPDPSSRFMVRFDPDIRLWVNDQRRFGWMRLMPMAIFPEFVAKQGYGPDPTDPTFTPEVLGEALSRRAGRPIKVALLDQTCVAGVGNIYADESLYRSRIHPTRRSSSLTEDEVRALHRELVAILEIAIPVGGALMRGNRRVAVEDPADIGRDFLQAHGCAGQECPRCRLAGPTVSGGSTLITKSVVGGRGTYTCAVCQVVLP